MKVTSQTRSPTCVTWVPGEMAGSRGDAAGRARLNHSREREEVGVQSIGVRQEEPVRGVFVHPQRAPLQQSSSLVTTELERSLDIAVPVYDQCRNVESSQLVTEIAGKARQEELHRCTR